MNLSNPREEILNIGRRSARAMRAAVAFALPQRCALCACATGDACLCDGCASAIAPAGPACPRCALPTPAGAVCGRCVAHQPAFDATIAAGLYAFPLDRLVMRLKYAADLPLAGALGAQLARVAAASGAIPRVDALVPMPLAAARQRARGCNQAREIAKALSHATGLPIARGLVRLRHGVPQAALPWRERGRNVRGAFAASRAFDGARLALVDDVMTTGATASAAAAVLRGAGAAHVEAWVVARTPMA
jgi:ComF family protein